MYIFLKKMGKYLRPTKMVANSRQWDDTQLSPTPTTQPTQPGGVTLGKSSLLGRCCGGDGLFSLERRMRKILRSGGNLPSFVYKCLWHFFLANPWRQSKLLAFAAICNHCCLFLEFLPPPKKIRILLTRSKNRSSRPRNVLRAGIEVFLKWCGFSFLK